MDYVNNNPPTNDKVTDALGPLNISSSNFPVNAVGVGSHFDVSQKATGQEKAPTHSTTSSHTQPGVLPWHDSVVQNVATFKMPHLGNPGDSYYPRCGVLFEHHNQLDGPNSSNSQMEKVQKCAQNAEMSKSTNQPGFQEITQTRHNWSHEHESDVTNLSGNPWLSKPSIGTTETCFNIYESKNESGQAKDCSVRAWPACSTNNTNISNWTARKHEQNSNNDENTCSSSKRSRIPRLPRVLTNNKCDVVCSIRSGAQIPKNTHIESKYENSSSLFAQRCETVTNQTAGCKFAETSGGQQGTMERIQTMKDDTSKTCSANQPVYSQPRHHQRTASTSPIRLVMKCPTVSRFPGFQANSPGSCFVPPAVSPISMQNSEVNSPAQIKQQGSSGLTPKISSFCMQASPDYVQQGRNKIMEEMKRKVILKTEVKTKLVDYGLSETEDSEEDKMTSRNNNKKQNDNENWINRKTRNVEKRKNTVNLEKAPSTKKRCSNMTGVGDYIWPNFIGPVDTRCVVTSSAKKNLEVSLNDNNYLQELENRIKEMKRRKVEDLQRLKSVEGQSVTDESKKTLLADKWNNNEVLQYHSVNTTKCQHVEELVVNPKSQENTSYIKNEQLSNKASPFWATCKSYNSSPLLGYVQSPPKPTSVHSTWYSPQNYTGYGYTPSSSPSLQSDSSFSSDSEAVRNESCSTPTTVEPQPPATSHLPPRLRFLKNSMLVNRNNIGSPARQSNWKSEFKEKCNNYKMKYIDSHCHLDFLINRQSFKGTWSKYMLLHHETFPDNYEGCIAVFCSPGSFRLGGLWKDIALEDSVWLAFGCHPKSATEFTPVAEEGLKQCLKHNKVVALGEIGLDYSGSFRQHEEQQKVVFRRQIQIALDINKPLVIHCRDAEDDCLEILIEMVPKNYKIHCHCFTGDYHGAQRWMNTFPNLYIGLTPVVTYKRAAPSHNVARFIPLEKLLLETDAPYFIPRKVPKNEMAFSHPGMAITVAEQVAYFKGCSVQEVLVACRQNTRDMYGI